MKKFVLLLTLFTGVVVNVMTSRGAVKELRISETIYDQANHMKFGRAIHLGYHLGSVYANIQPITLVIPIGQITNPLDIFNRPLPLLFTKAYLYPFLYPGVLEERDYSYIISQEKISQMISKLSHTVLKSRNCKIFVFHPSSDTPGQSFVMYRNEDNTTLLVVPEAN